MRAELREAVARMRPFLMPEETVLGGWVAMWQDRVVQARQWRAGQGFLFLTDRRMMYVNRYEPNRPDREIPMIAPMSIPYDFVASIDYKKTLVWAMVTVTRRPFDGDSVSSDFKVRRGDVPQLREIVESQIARGPLPRERAKAIEVPDLAGRYGRVFACAYCDVVQVPHGRPYCVSCARDLDWPDLAD